MRIPTPTVRELRRVLASVLAASPLACRSPVIPPAPPPLRPTPIPPDARVADARPPDAYIPDAYLPDAIPVDAYPRPSKKYCGSGDPFQVASCNTEVYLTDPPWVCGLPVDGRDLPIETCMAYCEDASACRVMQDYNDDGWKIFCQSSHPCEGRLASDGVRPRGLGALELARRLEAESVIAFQELAADLARWRAPAALVCACRRAVREEARHAATMTRLLRARGAIPARLPRRRPRGFASLFALAQHNEREGVVGETWGALGALAEAAYHPDADVRAAMRSIATDELGHAALSFRIAAWARARLPDAIAALDAERAAAAARLPALLAPLFTS